jgi:hypothetical protein
LIFGLDVAILLPGSLLDAVYPLEIPLFFHFSSFDLLLEYSFEFFTNFANWLHVIGKMNRRDRLLFEWFYLGIILLFLLLIWLLESRRLYKLLDWRIVEGGI